MDAGQVLVAFANIRGRGFAGSALRLSDLDLPRIGHTIGVGEDEIHAVLDVEAAGAGFDTSRRPKMLFEPHRFYANLGAGKARDTAVASGLAYAKWKPGAYPTDSYPRLYAALDIDRTAALASASWGLGQIMGENYHAAGYISPEHMVVAFVEMGEAEHLAAMIRFIVENNLDDELRAHNWAAFARGYNGPGYAANGYHTKLAAAYAKWAKIKDTPWSPDEDKSVSSVPTPPVDVQPLPAPAVPAPPAAVVVPVPTVPGAVVSIPSKETRTLWQRVADRLRAAYPVKGG